MQAIDYDSIAELYDVYVDSDLDVPFFLSEVERADGPVLELTSGTGRLSLPLLEAGAELTCVDSSRGMLDVLASKLARRGLEAELRCEDVRRLALDRRYRLAILPFQSFMEFVSEDDQRDALASVYSCLEDGGRFICTMHNPATRRSQVDGRLRLVGSFPMSDGHLVVSGFEQGGQPVVSRLQFFEYFGPNGRLARKRALAMTFTLIDRKPFERMAESIGFRVAGLYGDYRRSPFNAASSPFMIWVLERERSTGRE